MAGSGNVQMEICAGPTGFVFKLRTHNSKICSLGPYPPRAGGHSPLRQRCGHLSLADCLESVSETTAYGADRIMFSSGILDNFTKTSDFHSERMFS